MNLLLQALSCRPTPRRPIWILRQAGRYLPEYRALRARHRFEELLQDPHLAAAATMMPIERFGFDAAIVFADLVSPLAALGACFRFDPGPVLDRPIRSAAQIRALPTPDPAAIAPQVAETLRLVRSRLDGRAALIGFTGAPLSLAAYLVQGRGGSGFPELVALAASDPSAFAALLGKLSQLAAGYALAQAKAGADAVQIFDSWAGLLPLGEWTRLVRPHLHDLLEELGRAAVPRILYLHQAPELVEPFAALPCEALAVDSATDLAALRARLGSDRALQGNLDPAVLAAGAEATRRATEELLRQVPARGHIVNLGHGITPDAQLSSVQAMVDAVRAEEVAT
jgi:uroporphyrinogen decarboxylase